jgi:hypothetical protein
MWLRTQFGRERIYAFPTMLCCHTLQQACPMLDTGKDEGNAADGVFQQPVKVRSLSLALFTRLSELSLERGG